MFSMRSSRHVWAELEQSRRKRHLGSFSLITLVLKTGVRKICSFLIYVFFCCTFGLFFSSTLKLTREIFAFTSKQCQVMDISDEDDAGPWAPGEKKAKWEDHRFGLSKLDVFD